MAKEIKKVIKKVLFRNGNYWIHDSESKFTIDSEEVRRYFDSVKETPLSEEGEKIEENAILELIDINKGMKILDLGCGEGRWAKILDNKEIKYIGVDFSIELINKAKNNNFSSDVKFFSKPAQEYFSKDKFDLIFLFGLIPYMNDSDIKQLSSNCFKMLKDDGRLILRDVALIEKSIERKVYDTKYNLFRKILFFKRPRYQVIRRSLETEKRFFKVFMLLQEQMIDGTNLSIKIFKKSV